MKRIVSVAELPEGPPAQRGLSLDESIPGTKTYVKPLDDDGKEDPKEESIHRVDSPRSRGKQPSDRVEVVRQDGDTSFKSPGQNTTLPKYPYRDDRPNIHNATALGQRYLADKAPVRQIRTAATIDELITGLNPKFLNRAQGCVVSLKRADMKNLRWLFSVDAGNIPRVVKLKATRSGPATAFGKLDLHLACSCPAWRWWGPEHHSTTNDYQDPKTALQGTAGPPDIRDPERQNFVCKHVAAVLNFTRQWAIPPKTKKEM